MNKAIIKAIVVMIAVLALVTSACTLPARTVVQQPTSAPANTAKPVQALPTSKPPTETATAVPPAASPTAIEVQPLDLQLTLTPDASEEGTVKPPPRAVVIAQSGSYSIGGFCTVTVEFLSEDVLAVVFIERPLPRPLPDGVHKVAQACRVTYYKSDVFLYQLFPGIFLQHMTPDVYLEQLPPEDGSATICFAAMPQKQMSVHFYNTYAAAPVWAPLLTTVGDEGACADGSRSGTYVATFPGP